MKKYNKLVRDGVPDHIRRKGEPLVYHIATDAEYWEKLKEKISEEAEEFKKNESAEELADLLEVLDAVIEHKGFKREEIARLKKEKLEKRGAFKNRIILDES